MKLLLCLCLWFMCICNLCLTMSDDFSALLEVIFNKHFLKWFFQNVRSGYHIFHCHLDLNWFHLTVILILNNDSNMNDSDINEDISMDTLSSLNLNHLSGLSIVEFSIYNLISELVQISILRFEKVCNIFIHLFYYFFELHFFIYCFNFFCIIYEVECLFN